MKLYVIRRQDVFTALEYGLLPDGRFSHVGSLWVEVFLTPEEAARYGFPIREA